jgi:hypothetical protein
MAYPSQSELVNKVLLGEVRGSFKRGEEAPSDDVILRAAGRKSSKSRGAFKAHN